MSTSSRGAAVGALGPFLEASPDAVVAVAPGGVIALANEAACALFGYERDELVGQSVEQLLPERLRAHHRGQREAFELAPRARSMASGASLLGRRKDGSELRVDVSLAPYEHDGVRFTVALCARAGAPALDLHPLLQTLAAELAHDLNNVLATAVIHVSCLQADLVGAALKEDADAIAIALDHLQAISRRLAALSTGKRLRPEAIHLAEVVRGSEPLLRRLVEPDVALSLEGDDGAESVVATRDEVQRTLVNLVLNAREVMPRGGTPRVATYVRELASGEAAGVGVAPGRYGVLRVDDSGPGLDPANAARVFERGFSTKGSCGLGLSSVRRSTHGVGGYVAIESEPGHGTTVTVAWPVAGQPTTETT